jgi:hypothetical protein
LLYKKVTPRNRSSTPSPSQAAAQKPQIKSVSPKSDAANIIDDDDAKEKNADSSATLTPPKEQGIEPVNRHHYLLIMFILFRYTRADPSSSNS